ncbi:MAG: PEP-CTERM sorting domain-containing protein [Myxococcota bacterium]
MKKLLSLVLFAGLLVGMALPALATRPENRGNHYDRWLERREARQDARQERRAQIRERIRLYIAEAHPRGTSPKPTNGVPEPSSALVFGAGLLVASGVMRKRRN